MMMVDEPVSMMIEERARSVARPLPRGEVRIFDNWCKGCGLCVEFCPADVLGLGVEGRPRAIYPEKCTACRWCELHCPDFAIYIIEPGAGKP
jgi:2-oxoglutarate ferredoxin oxidoreductase subunit delta